MRFDIFIPLLIVATYSKAYIATLSHFNYLKKTPPKERLHDGSVYIRTVFSMPDLNSKTSRSSYTVIFSISFLARPSS